MLALGGLIYTFIWGCFYSYSQRNFSPAMPFLALATGLWFSQLRGLADTFNKIQSRGDGLYDHLGRAVKCISKFEKFHTFTRRTFLFHLVLAGLFSGIILSLQAVKFPDDVLQARQYEKLLNLGDPAVNKTIFDSFSRYGPGIILSNSQYLQYIPHIGPKYYRRFDFENCKILRTPEQINICNQELESALSAPDIKYILLLGGDLEAVNEILLRQGTAAQQIELDVSGYSYLRLR
jgi:hypothetical protein